MHMARRRKSILLTGDITPDLNSLLDVIFILLIFTMVSMQIGKIHSIQLDVSEIEEIGAENQSEDLQSIYLLEEGALLFQSKKFALRGEENWEVILKPYISGKTVLLISEKKVPYEDFLYLLTKIRSMSPESIELGAKARKIDRQIP